MCYARLGTKAQFELSSMEHVTTITERNAKKRKSGMITRCCIVEVIKEAVRAIEYGAIVVGIPEAREQSKIKHIIRKILPLLNPIAAQSRPHALRK